MTSVFIPGFLSMLGALARVFFVIIAAGFLVRKKIISQNDISTLSKIIVIVLLPCFVFANTLQSFRPDELPYWWLLPILGILMSLVGAVLATGVFAVDFKKYRNLIAVSSMQNAGYLVLPVGQVIYPQHFTEFTLITFLFILGYNPLLWTLGKYLVTSSEKSQSFDYRDLITPPAVANVISLFLVLIGFKNFFPDFLLDSVSLVGDAAVPVATFVLGATLGSVSLRKLPTIYENLRIIFVKYILLPVITILLLYYFDLGKSHPLLSDFMIIQAAAAPATGLILQVRAYGGDTQKVAGSMIVSYIICLFAMPFWIALWHYIEVFG